MWAIIKSKFERSSLGEIFFGILVWSFPVVIIFLTCLLFSDKKVRCYYMEASTNTTGIIYNIKADINWIPDITTFSSVNYKDVLEVLANLPKCKVEE